MSGLLPLALGFAAAHAIVIWTTFRAVHGLALGDVRLYGEWARSALAGHGWLGVTDSWVYPAGAQLPILAASGVAAAVGATYRVGWVALVVGLNAVLTVLLLRWGEHGRRAAWWYFGFLVALGPVSIVRLDAVAAVLAAVGLLVVVARPALSAALLVLAAWVKVWPAVLLLPVTAFLGVRRAARVVVPPLLASAGFVVVAVAAGGEVLGFLTAQTARGVQVESVAATPLLWWDWVHGRQAAISDHALRTYVVRGDAAHTVTLVSDAVLPLVAAGAALCLLRAWRRGAARTDLLVLGSFLLPVTVFAANKVGSPQYMSWLVPGVLAAIVTGRRGWTPAVAGTLVTAAATQVVFPYLYRPFLRGEVLPLLVLTLRNAALVALLAWALLAVVRLPGRATACAGPAGGSGGTGTARHALSGVPEPRPWHDGQDAAPAPNGYPRDSVRTRSGP
ncbi:MAG: hypothetical protein ACLGIA_01910 [Actinomycetes bacterium]